MNCSLVACLPQETGSYALLLRCEENRPVQIGHLGTLQLQPGTYVYVGSAFGPGGLRSRLAHHLRLTARPHWHLDYLRRYVKPQAIWYNSIAHRQAHLWAQLLQRSRGARQPLRGFGASDCNCPTHLFFFTGGPSFSGFHRRLYQVSGGRPALKSLILSPDLFSAGYPI